MQKITQPPLSFRKGSLAAGLRGEERVCPGLFVERFGGQVDAAGPHEGSGLRVDGDLGEIGGVVRWRQDAGPPLRGEVGISGCAGRGSDSKVSSQFRGLYTNATWAR